MKGKIGVYVCHCGLNIAGTVDVKAVAEYAQTLDLVVVARDYQFVCSEPGQALIRNDIKELGLNRVVVASCSPRMHEGTFRRVCQKAKLNPYLFEQANIREHCSWVHSDRHQATEKAKALVRAAVRCVYYHEPLETQEIPFNPNTLVVGAGIAGIQAALDIADSEHKVYLVERESSIGGHMIQLDTTFPTLDCSECILTPKMTLVGSHPYIELMAYSEVEEVSGFIGNFKVKIRKKARYVDEDKCNGCGMCQEKCPRKVDSEFNLGLGKRKAIYIPFPQAVPNIPVIDKKGTPPCKAACPGGIDVQGYVALISQGKFKEALDLIRRAIPLPAICGRVCTHPCETECNRGEVDEPIAIAALKRFVADYELTAGAEEITPAPRTKEEKVAIIGSGPAGLTAAHDLVLMGYGVTIFEALPVAGGMLAVGIPDYRLPKKILQTEIEAIQELGVEIRLNSPVGKNDLTIDDLWQQDYRAIFLAVGAHSSLKLDIPGEELEGVYHSVSFLRDVNLGKEVKVGERVAIVGGGNAAIDAARTALRLGSKEVSIVYRRSRQEMPASEEEIAEAEHEGIKIHYLAAPLKVLGEDGGVVSMECIRMELGEPDASGRRRPIPIEGSEFIINVDMVIPAIGQAPDLTFLPEDGKFQLSPQETFQVDGQSLATNIPGVFAGGDAVLGPATVIQAIAAGKRVATTIDCYLQGKSLPPENKPLPTVTLEDVDLTGIERANRAVMPTISPKKRIGNFEEVNLGFSQEMAVEEANRCLNCAVCSGCRECEKVCELNAIDFEQEDRIVEVEVGAIIVATGYDPFDARLKPEYGYGTYPNVLTGLELERLLSAAGPTQGVVEIHGRVPKNVVFIQCVGSRDKSVGNEYCSRVCCMYTAKHAHSIKEKIPDAKVTVFYMDIRAFGKGYEQFYERVQKEGVLYRRGSISEIYKRGDKLVVRAEDTLSGEIVEEEADLVILAVGLVPRKDALQVMRMVNISPDPDGFFLERHPKLDPIATATDGVFIVGCGQGPKDIPDTVAQASAGAAKVLALISKGRVTLEAATATVNEILCQGCGRCEEICQFHAAKVQSNEVGLLTSTINEALCKGCGACAVACPTGAISVKHFTKDEILSMVDALVEV